MTKRPWLTSVVAGMGGAVIIILAGLLWSSRSDGGLAGLLSGIKAKGLPEHADIHPSVKWENLADRHGYNTSCDYRIHLMISPEKAAKMSIDLSRYGKESSFLYPTVVSNHFLQALIIEPGEPIAVDLSDTDREGCKPQQASLSNLPGMCFETKIEQRC